jgi:hypothetical protein
MSKNRHDFYMSVASAMAVVAAVTSGTPAVVRRVMDAAGVAKLDISISLASRPARTLSRPAGEALRRSLQRILGAKDGLDDAALAALAQLRRGDGTVIEHDAAAEEAWAAATELRLGSDAMPVLFEPPEVTLLTTPALPLCGIPCTPYYSTRCCERSDVVLTWSCQAAQPVSGVQSHRSSGAVGEQSDWPERAWLQLGQGASFTPTAEHAGATLRVVATPPALPCQLPLQRTLVVGVVAAPPPRPVLAARLAALASVEPRREQAAPEASSGASAEARPEDRHSVRVMCYNLLADAYRRSWNDTGGVHSYCDPSFTVGKLRLPRLLSEILAADPDVACLQEVDVSW